MTEDWVHGVGHSPVCQILLQIVVRAVITSSPSDWTSSAGMLLTPADFAFFNDCTAASTSLRRMGWCLLCVCLGTVQYWWISVGFVIVQLREVFCPSVHYLSFFCEAFSWTILDSIVAFPLQHISGKDHDRRLKPWIHIRGAVAARKRRRQTAKIGNMENA